MSLTVTRTAASPDSRLSDFTRICHRYRPRSLGTGEGTGPRTVRWSGGFIDRAIEGTGAFPMTVRPAMDDEAKSVSRATQVMAASRTIFSLVPDTKRAIR